MHTQHTYLHFDICTSHVAFHTNLMSVFYTMKFIQHFLKIWCKGHFHKGGLKESKICLDAGLQHNHKHKLHYTKPNYTLTLIQGIHNAS